MRAVVITRGGGGPEVLEAQEVEDPAPLGDGEVLLQVVAAGVNRADTLQRHGRHPPPAGAPPYPGLECSGTILALGPNAPPRWAVGDKVCALLSGGGYAEKVVVPAGQLLPVPEGVSLADAAGLPEIHGGSSGIGTFAIQIAKHLGIMVFVTAGTEEKLAACKGLGADVCINYKTEDFVERVKQETNGKGVDVILDNIGGPYLERNLNSLGVDGRLFIIGFQGGAVAEVNLQAVFAWRLTIQAAGLRGRSAASKTQIVSEVEKNVWPAVAAGKVNPVIYKTFPLSEAADAHRLIESSMHIGKILLLP
ncbi:oxidoreductase zinc-binding dehydrogenase family protein [Zea mays]|uniref:Oxidoreductase zinc-binding dehydrogenase family protein n=1 Tax=Zea mays TaxID=4577 RepID=A0A1D6QBR6_MAIZE|nr:oxidoreductase zinc-binding dehydrogenase family protein [Zea mays]